MTNEVSTHVNQGGITGAEWLTPATMSEGMKLAELMADCTLVPDHLKKKPGDCFPILVQALRWRMDPFAVAQCTAVVRGKLCYEGKLVHAVLISMGAIDGRLSFEYSGQGQARSITVTGTPRGGKASSISGTVAQWKTENGNWQKDPDMMLAYRGTRAWARLFCPDAMLGVYTPDEMQEVIIETTAEVVEPVAAKPRTPVAQTAKDEPAEPAEVEATEPVPTQPQGVSMDTAKDEAAKLFGMGQPGKKSLRGILDHMGIAKVQDCPADKVKLLVDGLRGGILMLKQGAGNE